MIVQSANLRIWLKRRKFKLPKKISKQCKQLTVLAVLTFFDFIFWRHCYSFSDIKVAPTPNVQKTYTDENYDVTTDLNMQVYLRLNFLKGGATEKILLFVKTCILSYGKKMEDERQFFLFLEKKNPLIFFFFQ